MFRRSPFFFVFSFVIPCLVLILLTGLLGGHSWAAPAADGDLDSSFGTAGKTTTDIQGASSDGIKDIAVANDGKLVAVGFSGPSGNASLALARYNPNGTLDTSFGTNGRVVVKVREGAGDVGFAVAVDGAGRIVAAGESYHTSSVQVSAFLVRLNPDGSLDTSFGAGGRVVTSVEGSNVTTARDLALQPDGRILIAGAVADTHNRMLLARFNQNGSLDASFGTAGKVVYRPATWNLSPQALLLRTDGKILVVGQAHGQSSAYGVMLARYNTNGAPDTGFGGEGDGIVITTLDNPVAVSDARFQTPDGRILVAGTSMTDFLLARFNSNGVLDLTFGATGRTRTDFGGREVANALTLQPDGKILLAGYHSTDYTGEVSFALARYTADGELDGSFGARGKVTTAFARPHGGGAEDVAVQPNGRIVAAGGAEQDFALAGYRSGLAGAATPPPTSTPGCIFTDVCPGDFFYTPVEQLVLRGAISGYGDGTFQPYNSTTRSQLVKIVVVAAGFPLLDPSNPTFGDVPRHFAFYTYVETAVARGIISGYDVPGMAQREFRPFHGITRGQICKIVVKAAGWSLVDPPRPTFDDVPASNPFYGDIETAVAHGVISGYALPNGGREFRWFNPATRGQISKIIYEAVTR